MLPSLKNKIIKKCPGIILKPTLMVVRGIKTVQYKSYTSLFPKRMPRFCPCCGMRFKSFTTGPYLENPQRFNPIRYTHTRQDVLCPFCRAFPRHRILALWCERHVQYLRSAEILYFAPEYSMMLWIKRKGITCKTADLYNKADLKLDIQSTGLSDESYDVIICNHVLEHVDDYRTALKEVFRLLRGGGMFICSFPMDKNIELIDEEKEPLSDEERILRFGQNDHKRVFGMKADQFLTEAGFIVETIKGEDYPDEILPVVGPADYDMNILFCCRKPE